MSKKVLNDLFDYDNLKIYQYEDAFKFSLDSILLAEFVNITKRTTRILDLCCGNAAVPLILSTKTTALIDAFEIQKEIFDLAVESIKYNSLTNQINVYNDTIKNIDNYYKKNYKFDIITCNPPYFKVNKKNNINISQMEAIARHEIHITLEEIFSIASNYLADGGEFYIVHRATRLDELIINANKYNLNVKKIELIKTNISKKPCIVLLKCVKNSRLGVIINDTKCINNLKTYKNIFKEE